MITRKVGFTLIAATALAACSGTTVPPKDLDVEGQPCHNVVTPVMVYPAPGATGIPDGNFSVILSNHTVTLTLNLVNSNVVQVYTALPVPNPTDPRQSAYAVPALQPQTTYSVLARLQDNDCLVGSGAIPLQLLSLGSFTTQ